MDSRSCFIRVSMCALCALLYLLRLILFPLPASMRLYKHAPESIFAFCASRDLSLVMAVSRDWSVACSPEHAFCASQGRAQRLAVAQVRLGLQCAHLKSLSCALTVPMVANALARLTRLTAPSLNVKLDANKLRARPSPPPRRQTLSRAHPCSPRITAPPAILRAARCCQAALALQCIDLLAFLRVSVRGLSPTATVPAALRLPMGATIRSWTFARFI